MDDLTGLAEFIENANAKVTAETHVIKHLLATLIARHAREYSDPDEYVMTMIAPIVSEFDKMKADGSAAEIGFDHGVSVCNWIETRALSLVSPDQLKD